MAVASFDVQALHLLVEAFPCDPQAARRRGAAALVGVEGAADQPGFDPAEGFTQGFAGLDVRPDGLENSRQAVGELSRGQRHVGLGNREGPLDLVFQLPDVAWPAVGLEQVRGLAGECAGRTTLALRVAGKEVFRELPMEFAVEAGKLLEVSLEGAVG